MDEMDEFSAADKNLLNKKLSELTLDRVTEIQKNFSIDEIKKILLSTNSSVNSSSNSPVNSSSNSQEYNHAYCTNLIRMHTKLENSTSEKKIISRKDYDDLIKDVKNLGMSKEHIIKCLQDNKVTIVDDNSSAPVNSSSSAVNSSAPDNSSSSAAANSSSNSQEYIHVISDNVLNGSDALSNSMVSPNTGNNGENIDVGLNLTNQKRSLDDNEIIPKLDELEKMIPNENRDYYIYKENRAKNISLFNGKTIAQIKQIVLDKYKALEEHNLSEKGGWITGGTYNGLWYGTELKEFKIRTFEIYTGLIILASEQNMDNLKTNFKKFVNYDYPKQIGEIMYGDIRTKQYVLKPLYQNMAELINTIIGPNSVQTNPAIQQKYLKQSNESDPYYAKYLKYKQKYSELKNKLN